MKDEQRTEEQPIPASRTWLYIAGIFVLLCILEWLNEIVDLPHLLLGAPRTPINWHEAAIEMVLIAIVGLFVVSILRHDIAQRTQAEEGLKKAEQEKAAILGSMSELVSYQDSEMRILWANKAAGESVGLTPEQLIGHHCYEIWQQRSEPCVGCPVVKAREVGQPQEGEMTTPDGRVWLIRGYPVRNAKGDVVGVVEVTMNITERQRAEEEIRQRTAQLEALRQVGMELAAQLDLDTLLRSIVSRAIELANGTCGGLYLYRPERDVLEWAMAVGPHLAPIGTVLQRGEGLSGRVWETGEPLIVDDYQAWEGRAAVYEGYPFRAVVGVPVRWGEEFLGVLNVLADPPHTFSPADAELLSLFATQAAIAIRNAHLYEETQRRALEQETLSRIAYALNTPDIRDAFPVLVEGLQDLTNCDVVNLMVLDEAGEQFAMTVLESPFPILEEGEVMPFSATAAAKDIEAGRPHLTADLNAETHFPFEQALYQAGLRSYVTLPLLVGGEIFGALNLGSTRPCFFRDEQLPGLRHIADAVALALENSLLFYTEHKQRQLAESLGETAIALTATLDFNQVLDRILEQVSRVVPNDATNIMLLEGDQARIVRWRGYERFGAEEFVSTVIFRIPEVPNLQQMLESKEPMVIPDTATYPGWVHIPVQEWLRSYAAAPIIVRGEVIGFLNVDSATPDFFTQADAEVLRAFAVHAAAALENARLYEAEQKRRHIADTLRQASAVLSSTLELNEVLGLILHQLRQVIPYDSASIQQLQDKRLEIVACQGFDEPDKVVGLVFPLDPKFPNYRVVTAKAPLAIKDVIEDYPHFKNEANIYESGRIRSWLGVPLMVKDEVIGMIAVDRAEVRPYTAEEVQLAMAFANQAAVAIENARLYAETRRRLAREERLNELAHALGGAMELATIIPRLLPLAIELTGADAGTVAVLDPDRQVITYPYNHNLPDSLASIEVPAGAGLAGHTMAIRQPVLLDDYCKHPAALQPWVEAGVRSMLAVPLLAGDEVVGSLGLFSLEKVRPFGPEAVAAAEAAGRLAAVAIQRARLYEDTRHRATELSTLYEVVTAGMTSVRLDEVLNRTMTALQETLQPDDIAILLVEPETNELIIRAHTGYPGGPKLVRRPIGVGIPGWVVQTGQPALLADVRGDERYYACDPDTRSELCVPLRVGERIIGALNLESRRLGAFSEDDLRLLSILAGHLAAVIENARLFEEIEERRLYLEGVLGAAPDAIVTLDAQNRVVEWNPGAERLFGYSREEAIGRDLDHLVTSPDVFEEAVGFKRIVLGGEELPPREAIRYRKDGSPVNVLLAGSPILVGNKLIGAVAVYTDITQRKRMEDELRALLLVDELTGLYNRRGFLTLAKQQLKMADRAKMRMALLFADYNGLKQINDTFGHPEGDRALIEVAQVFRETFRESDIIARLGGDEFVVLALETVDDSAEVIATRLQQKLEARNAKGDLRYKLSLSLGMAHYNPESPCSVEELIAWADRSMYERKRGNQ
jgi:diguanylate cyclase (GGDEF)-like protein/PAS domain S-box-containing protein